MFDWLKPGDLANGLVAEAIAMCVEIFVIVRVIEWRRQKEEHHRMTRFRSRTRKHLRRSLAAFESNLDAARDSLDQLDDEAKAASPNGEPMQFPSASAAALQTILHRFERLGRDFALFMPSLDEPSYATFEAALNQLEWMLNVWIAQRLTDPAFPARWEELSADERLKYLSHLEELRRAVRETSLIVLAIDARLNYAETQEGGDAALLEMAAQLANGTHACSRARNWPHLLDRPKAPPQGAQT